MSTRLNAWTSALCVVAAIGVSLAAEPTSPVQAGAIPDRLTNQEFVGREVVRVVPATPVTY